MSITSPTAVDLAHLQAGDEVDVSFAAVPYPVRIQTALADHDGNLRAGAWTVRFAGGVPGPVLVALHSPLPPALPVGQRRRSLDGTEAIRTDHPSPSTAWVVYLKHGGERWFSDDEVADWQVISDQVIPRYAMLDVWNALGHVLDFEAWRDSCTYDEAWAQLMDWVRRRPKPEPVTDQTIGMNAKEQYAWGEAIS